MTKKVTIQHAHKKVVAKHHHVAPALAKYQEESIKTTAGKGNKPKPKSSMIAVWIGFAVVIAAMLGIGFWMLQRQAAAERVRKASLQDLKDRAQAAYTDFEECLGRIDALVEPAHELRKKSEADMAIVLGGEIPKEFRRSKWMEEQGAPAPAAGTPAPETQPQPRQTERRMSAKDAKDREAIPGVMSREQIIRRRQLMEQGVNPDGKPSLHKEVLASQLTPPANSVYDKRKTDRMEPEIVSLARHVRVKTAEIEDCAFKTREKQYSARRMKEKVVEETRLPQARLTFDKLTALIASVTVAADKSKEDFADIEKTCAKMVTIRKDVEEKRAELERKQKEERRKREYAERVKTEEQMSHDLRAQAAESLRKNDFEGALALAQGELAGYRTTEGQAKVKILIDRYQRTVDLKKFLIEQLSQAPMSFGWIQDGTPMDVVGADASGVKVKDKTTAWAKIKMPQLLKFIKFYCNRVAVRRSARGENYFNAAVLFQELGKSDVAVGFREDALSLAPELSGEINRLLE